MSARAELYDKDGEKRLSLSIVADHVLALCQPKKQRTMKQDERAPAPSPKFDDNPPVWLGLEMNDTPAKENPTIHEIRAAQLALHDKAPTSEGESVPVDDGLRPVNSFHGAFKSAPVRALGAL